MIVPMRSDEIHRPSDVSTLHREPQAGTRLATATGAPRVGTRAQRLGPRSRGLAAHSTLCARGLPRGDPHLIREPRARGAAPFPFLLALYPAPKPSTAL